MKKSLIWILVAAAIVLYGYTKYNGLVTLDEGVETEWANVETQYQRRADLIPNLVNTVKGYAEHEKSTLEEVVAARARATSVNLSASELTPEKLAEFQKAQQAVTSSLGRLIAVAESYPDLKASQNFQELQAQLEGTENRIAVARTKYNETVRNYNIAIRRFPANIVASLFGFDRKALFAASEGADEAPVVQF